MFFSKYMYSISLSHQKIIEIKHVKVSLPILQGWEGKQKTWILRFSMKRLYGGWATSKTTHYTYWSLDTVSYSLFFECGQNTPISMKIIKSFAKRWWQVTTWSWPYFLFCVLLPWYTACWIWKKVFTPLVTLKIKGSVKPTAPLHTTFMFQGTSSFLTHIS